MTMTSRSDNHAHKKLTPATRPLLNQAPLNIENLPSRIQKGECNVLPPRFCPPMTLPPMTCPPTACQPCPPCQPYCMPPSCYCPPSPCSPCTPMPPPMCCPPPCQPIFVCPPPCTPVQCPPPCMPSPPPPPCCPPPPCPPPPCQPCCVPKSGCCGGNSCCCGPKKQIICVPRRAQPGMMSGGCGNNSNQSENAACSGTKNKSSEPSIKPGFGDQPASYNNCNFYLTEVPKSLKNRFGIGASSSASRGGGDEECIEEDEAEKCTDEVDECMSGRGEDDECDDMMNIAAGDDQIVHPPVGYPGSKRTPWGAGYSRQGNNDGTAFGMGGYGRGTRRGSRDPTGYERRGSNNSSRGRGGSGGGSGRNTGNRNTAARGMHGKGPNGSGSPLEGSPNGSVQHGGVDQYGRKGGNVHGKGQNGRGGGDSYGRDPNGARSNQYGGKNIGKSRYITPEEEEDGEEEEDDEEYNAHNREGSDNSGRRFGAGKSKHPNEDQLAMNQMNKSGATSRYFSATSGYRPYSYSNAELIQKSDAYLPEKYDVPTPHEQNSRIHPSRAPITPYATFNHPDDDYEARTIYSNPGKSTYAASKSTYKHDFGHMTAQSNRSQATMMPSCSTLPKTQHTHTSTRRLPSTRTTAVPPRYHYNSTGVGTVPPSKSHYTTKGVGTATPSRYNSTGVGTVTPSTSHYNTAGIGTSRSLIKSEKRTVRSPQTHKTNPPRAQSHPTFRQQRQEDQEESIRPPPVAHKTTTQLKLETIQSESHEPSEISKRHSGAISNVTDDNDNFVTDDDAEGNGRENRAKRPFDPCHPPKTCLKYHTKRLHRLCSFSKQREKRLSDIHKPMFHFKTPPCPIRETNASILRKTPPGKCQWHEQKVPPFHEYCMTDRLPDSNRYPLLTREFSPLRHEHENQHVSHNHNPNTPAMQQQQRQVEARGAKRKNHHR